MWRRGFLKVCAATVVYAAVHSALASRTAKRAAESLMGPRQRNALYRPFYLVQSAVTIALLIAYIRRQPKLMLYRHCGLAAMPFRAGQVGGVVWAICAALEVGMLDILGIRGLAQLVRREDAIASEPEAQGPALGGDGRLRVSGPFRLSRHPLNLAPFIILWLNPRMSSNLLAFNLVATAYLVVGSWHEEVRLRSAYGDEYAKYQESRVPFYVPGIRQSV